MHWKCMYKVIKVKFNTNAPFTLLSEASNSETEILGNFLVPQTLSYNIPSFHPALSSHFWLTVIIFSKFLGFTARDAPVVCLDARLIVS